MNWSVSLIVAEEESIEERLGPIVSYVIKANQIDNFVIHDIDATGPIGSQLTKEMNLQNGPLSINENDLSTLFTEDGQVFELNLFLISSFEFRIIIRDGGIIDILGNGDKLPLTVTGDFIDLDIDLFRD
jgi:hypothetical protein